MARLTIALAAGAAGWLLPLPGAGAAAADAWVWPLDPRPPLVAPFDAPAGPYGPGHRGVDLLAAPGASALAIGTGVVAFAGEVAGRGVVAVDHAGGLRSTYEPVDAGVRAGDPVAAGQPLGVVAAAGGHCLPRSCLHLGVLDGSDTYRDPMSLLGPARVRLLPVWDGAAGSVLSGPGARGPTGRAAGGPGTDGRRSRTGERLAGLVAAGAAVAGGGLLARRRGLPPQRTDGRSAASRR